MQLIGRFYHALEQKGRLSIPASLRNALGTNAILTLGLDGCLFLFDRNNWQAVVADISQKPFTQKNVRDWVRLLANNASEVSFDALGRIHIPEYLRTQASLTKRVCVVGSLNRVEIWDQEKYHAYLESIETKKEIIAESLTQT